MALEPGTKLGPCARRDLVVPNSAVGAAAMRCGRFSQE